MSSESLEELKNVDYPVKISFDPEEKVYVAEYMDLPGCSAYGDTVEDAYRLAQEAKEAWLRVSLEQGLPIPKPVRTEEHSGRILARVPSALHGLLSEQSRLHGVSLNQYMVHLLSAGVVGDSVSTEIERLREKISQLEWRIAQLTSTVKGTYNQPSQGYTVASTSNVNVVVGGISGWSAAPVTSYSPFGTQSYGLSSLTVTPRGDPTLWAQTAGSSLGPVPLEQFSALLSGGPGVTESPGPSLPKSQRKQAARTK